jgi:hypothetical protein
LDILAHNSRLCFLSDPKNIAAGMEGQFMRGAPEILAQPAGLASKTNNQQIGP